ncbi:unnamed protein product [Lymnaea stagnalis]|uniref:C-type lectin domain-containing protein n=1 Tax=Lymnaea stagnalis TaxID=6523 RepID=A0AAV2I4Q4_LYMST
MKRIFGVLCGASLLVVSVVCVGQAAIFKSLTQVNVTMVSFGRNWTEANAIACARLCLSFFRSCYSFVYKKETGKCIPGSWLVPSAVSFDAHSGVLYSRGSFCPSNFTVRQASGLASCLQLFTNKTLNYTSSISSCKAIKSVIYTMKSVDKRTILHTEVKSFNRSFWIGLDDLAEKGGFAWADDGRFINANLSIRLFAPDEPNNHNSVEDCVVYNSSRGGLNDVQCNLKLPSACEMNPNKSVLKDF